MTESKHWTLKSIAQEWGGNATVSNALICISPEQLSEKRRNEIFVARCGALTCSQKGAFPSLPHLELVAKL